ncbi:probable protein ABIL5 isoform X1 [Benincasa hispida]|uniref:probable protein ABIL5 isoform X1 n=1 Tax=Benincasa hispida TaxID=102211 RepID=UPI0019022D40|nr:probable protein ABIL5 isoform X1 [Benincasa hispida]
MLSSISSGGLNAEGAAEEATSFQNALLELKGLRSQLHQAADYCETTFLKTKEKNEVLENTKEYVCRAMVTVVDHLGNVTSNLESCISQTNAFNEVELRLNCLNQRLLTCKQYSQKLELCRLRWSEILPRYHPRYVSPVSKNAEQLTRSSSMNQWRDSKDLPFAKTIDNCKPDIFTDKPMPVLLYKFYTYNLSLSKNLSHRFTSKKDDKEKTIGKLQKAILPAGDHGFSVQPKGPNSTFYFQVSNQKRGRHRKSKLGSDIFSLLKRTKQIA